jgi:hypothetical protein
MRVLLAILMVLGASLLLTATQAQDKTEKEVTIKGKICCAKCELAETKECWNAIVTKKDGKDVTIYFDKDTKKKEHAKICSAPKEGSVTGIVTEKDNKKYIAVKTIKFE